MIYVNEREQNWQTLLDKRNRVYQHKLEFKPKKKVHLSGNAFKRISEIHKYNIFYVFSFLHCNKFFKE